MGSISKGWGSRAICRLGEVRVDEKTFLVVVAAFAGRMASILSDRWPRIVELNRAYISRCVVDAEAGFLPSK
jgi:hypothetical protein